MLELFGFSLEKNCFSLEVEIEFQRKLMQSIFSRRTLPKTTTTRPGMERTATAAQKPEEDEAEEEDEKTTDTSRNSQSSGKHSSDLNFFKPTFSN